MRDETVKDIDPVHAALGGKVFPHARAKVFAEWGGIAVQRYPGDAVTRCLPHLVGQIEMFRRQRFYRAALPRLSCIASSRAV